jgi:mRNA-degrading endonuclease YafQ of YafQ-DinJ toxin-antitoxin module
MAGNKLTPAIYPATGRPLGAPSSGGAVPRLADETSADESVGDDSKVKFEEFEDEAAFLEHYVKTYTNDLDADKHNLDEAKEDLRFIYVDQWDPAVRAQREKDGRPCITVNTLPQFIGQVIGDRRINKTAVKVLPSTNASVDEAEVRTGLIRSIENFSRADRVYDTCCEDQVGAGISAFEITMEYAYNDVFHQDIFVRQLDNPFAVIWDRFSKDPTGRDAKHCFVEETMPRKAFEKDYPDAAVPTATIGEYTFGDEAQENDDVKILALWRMIHRPARFALMQDGDVEDVTDKPEEQWLDRAYVDEQGQAYVKEGKRTYAQRYLITSTAVLEGPYELPISRLPIIKVSGRVGRVGVKQYRFGLIRWAREPSLMRNYWRSIAVETLAMAPKSQWLADHASVKGREQDFRDAHNTGDPLLIYNAGKNIPKRTDPPQMPTAVLNEAAMNTQDIKDVTGLHDASLGVRSNEVSGKAIMARQREGDVATIVYHDNLNQAIMEGGCVINELVPIAYDTTRMIRVIGEDERIAFQKINDPTDDSVDITAGKYDVQIITGPSYTTKRMEAADSMMEAMKVMPEAMSQALDLIVEAQDWPGSQRIAARLKKIIPAAQQEEADEKAEQQAASGEPAAPPEPSPEEQAAAAMQAMQLELAQAQHAAQMAEFQAQAQMAADKARQEKARADEAEARAKKAVMDLEVAEDTIRSSHANAETAEAKAISAHQDIERDEEEHEANMQRAHDSHVVSIHQKMNPTPKPGGDTGKGGPRSASGSRP